MRLRTLLLLFATMTTAMSWAGNINAKLFIFGFVSSFNDSTVYFTTIHETDSAWIDKKTKFLYSRDNYSYQLRNFMREQGVENPTCVTIYAQTRKKIEKKYSSLLKRYQKNGFYTIKYVTPTEFVYNTITPDKTEMDGYDNGEKELKKKQKKERKKRESADEKDPMLDGNRPARGGNRPPQPPQR